MFWCTKVQVFFEKYQFKMLVVLLPISVADTKIMYGYNFVAPLNSASEITNIWIASIAFKLFCDKRFLVFVFTMFMWLKNHSRLAFENSAHEQITIIKDIPFQLALFLLRIKIFPHKSFRLMVGKEKYWFV